MAKVWRLDIKHYEWIGDCSALSSKECRYVAAASASSAMKRFLRKHHPGLLNDGMNRLMTAVCTKKVVLLTPISDNESAVTMVIVPSEMPNRDVVRQPALKSCRLVRIDCGDESECRRTEKQS